MRGRVNDNCRNKSMVTNTTHCDQVHITDFPHLQLKSKTTPPPVTCSPDTRYARESVSVPHLDMFHTYLGRALMRRKCSARHLLSVGGYPDSSGYD